MPHTCRSRHPPGPAQLGGFLPFGHSRLNALWATFDNAKSRSMVRERHVVGHYRLGEALEGERTDLFGCDASL